MSEPKVCVVKVREEWGGSVVKEKARKVKGSRVGLITNVEEPGLYLESPD